MAGHAPKPVNRVVGGLVLAFLALFVAMVAWPVAQGSNSDAALAQAPADAPRMVLTLKDGEVVFALRPDLAPNHVARITELANSGFYDGLNFHRVITGFMAQTGDPLGNGTGGSDLPNLEAEFSSANFVRGTLGMARSMDPNSANSQFFIVTADSPHLNGQYTLFGEVVEGMEFVDNIEQGDPRANGVVQNPDQMISLRVIEE